MDAELPDFPPLLNGIAVEPGKDTADAALASLKAGEAEAGDLFWSQSQDRLNMSVVLEPEHPLQKSAQMLHLMAVAFGDAFGAISPPEISVQYRWPGDILVNDAKAGHVGLTVPDGVGADAVPEWMVLTLDVAVTLDLSVENPGDAPDRTTLHEEGAGEVTSYGLLYSVSRHFLTWLDTWDHEGFKSIHENWVGRAAGLEKDIEVTDGGNSLNGRVTGMDEDGNLLFQEAGSETTKSLDLLNVLTRVTRAS